MSSNNDTRNDYSKASENIDTAYLVSASAGTGKTRVLVNRYLNILQKKNADLDEIVAITFTEKAAAEMKERIRRSLYSKGGADSRIVDRLNSAPISTIHSFCARVLQENVEEIGIDPQFRIIDEVEEQILRKESLNVFLHNEMTMQDSDIMTLIGHFDLSQIREMLNIVWKKQQDFSESLNNLSKETATDLFQKTKQHHRNHSLALLQYAFQTTEVNQACKFLNSHNAKDSQDTLQLAKIDVLNVIREIQSGKIPAELENGSLSQVFNLKRQGKKGNWGPELNSMREKFRRLRTAWDAVKDQIIDFDDALERQNADLLIVFTRFARNWIDYFRNLQNENGVVDFNGLEILTEAFFETGSAAAKKYSKRFKHLLVDEFQDISPVQDRILTALCGLNPAITSFYVGDEKQSIYRFRGAEVEIFNRYKRRKELLYLDENYRSLQTLNKFFNHFFPFLMNTSELTPEYDVRYDKPVMSYDKTRTTHIPVEMLLLKPEGKDTDIDTDLTDTDAEFVNVIQAMKSLYGREIVKNSNDELRRARWRDFAILLRSRTHQEKLERILNRAGVPYYVSAGIGFYQRREVLDVINFLRALINFFDEIALIGTLRSPMVGFSDDALMALSSKNGLMDGIRNIVNGNDEHLVEYPDVRHKFQQFMDLYQRLQGKMMFMTTAEILQNILHETNYLAVLAAFPEEKQSIANVIKLVDLAVEWSHLRDISPVDFIRRVQLYQSMEIREGEANLSSEIEDSVTIMTIHAAKGLSFPIVVVPQLANRQRNSYPRILSNRDNQMAFNLKTTFNDYRGYLYRYLVNGEKKRAEAEEKRILYVAATRAESYLMLSAIDKSGSSNKLWNSLKPFFEEPEADVPKHVTTYSDAVKSFANLNEQAQQVTQCLNPAQKEEILELIKPAPVRQRIEKVTPTAFASWLSAQRKSLPAYEKYAASGDNFESERALSAMNIGTIIHQAFSWWNFQDIRKLRKYTEELLKPYALSETEVKRYLEMFAEWGGKFIQPKNTMATYIKNAAEQIREVDIYGWLFNTLIEGKIDLLLKMRNDEYIIVDFKSDRIDKYPEKATMIKYNAQLDLYALMLSRGSKLTVAKTCLYFIRNGLLIEQECTNATLKETEEQLQKYIQSV